MLRQRARPDGVVFGCRQRASEARRSSDDGLNQRLFKAKQCERSSGVNEYAARCHALFLYPAVVRRRERGERSLFRSGLPWRLWHPAPTARNDADCMKHMLFLPHKQTPYHFSRAFRLCTEMHNLSPSVAKNMQLIVQSVVGRALTPSVSRSLTMARS